MRVKLFPHKGNLLHFYGRFWLLTTGTETLENRAGAPGSSQQTKESQNETTIPASIEASSACGAHARDETAPASSKRRERIRR
jgi:hypothetical protein